MVVLMMRTASECLAEAVKMERQAELSCSPTINAEYLYLAKGWSMSLGKPRGKMPGSLTFQSREKALSGQRVSNELALLLVQHQPLH
jgi:hypothetical protein